MATFAIGVPDDKTANAVASSKSTAATNGVTNVFECSRITDEKQTLQKFRGPVGLM
jgi:hypothetical protein